MCDNWSIRFHYSTHISNLSVQLNVSVITETYSDIRHLISFNINDDYLKFPFTAFNVIKKNGNKLKHKRKLDSISY